MTDAEFLRFLRHGASRLAVIVEIEFAYESAGAMATGTIHLADCSDAVAGSQPYHDVLERAPDLERTIDLARLGGRGGRSLGTISVNNTDDAMGFLLTAIIDGRDAAIYIGERGAARSDFRMLGKGVVASVSAPSDAEIVIELRDKNFLLDDTIIGDTIATGPNAGKPKPILLGRVKNFDISPYLVDSASLKYYINNFPLSTTFDAIAVREMGLSLRDDDLFFMDSGNATADTATETINCAAHLLNTNDVIKTSGIFGLTSGLQYWVINPVPGVSFQLSLTKGGAPVNLTIAAIPGGSHAVSRRRYYFHASDAIVELSAEPSGRVTIDLAAVEASGDLTGSDTPHNVFKWLIENHTQLEAADFDETAIDALAALEASESLRYGRAILDRMNVLDLLDEIASASRSWYAWGADGVLTVGRLDLANLDAATADAEIGEGDLLDQVSAENLALPWGKVFVNARRNVVVQTDGLSSDTTLLLAEDRSKWVQSHQTRVSTTDPGTAGYLANWWDYHKSAIDSRPLAVEVDSGAQNACDEITDLFRPWTRVHRCAVALDKYGLNPGDCVTVTYPRHGLESGAKCRVISARPRVSDRVVNLVLVRQAIPDYTTAVH